MPPFEHDRLLTGLYGLSENEDDDHPLPLTGVQVEAQVQDFIAEVKLSQCYYNNTNKTLECVFHFPIYEGAAVCGFEAEYQNGSVVKGVVKEKSAAKQQYIEARRAGKQANLLESVRRDVFTLSIGNLPPDMYIKINITYVMTLESRDSSAAFILPTYIAPRYIPSETSVCESDAQALAPPQSNVVLSGLQIRVDVTCRSVIKTVTSPTHREDLIVSINDRKGHFALKDVTMDRDIVVLIEEEKCHQPRASIEISHDNTMTGFVTFYPKIQFPDQTREFVFVIDRSGSMSGRQIEEARDVLLLFLRSLPASCVFNIVGFGSSYSSLFDRPQPYNDETLKVASEYAASMQANFGGTEILAPLLNVFGQPLLPGVERQVFVLTDGQVSNNGQVFDAIRNHCTAEKRTGRLFSVGIGRNVSRLLVSGMARAGRGTSCFVENGSGDALRAKVLGQLKQSMQPALDNVSIEWTFPKEEAKPAPVSDAAPIKTLLGYRSPALDDDGMAAQHLSVQPRLCPSIIPPVFNKDKFLVYAMFPNGALKPNGVVVKCDTIDGPLEVKLDITADEIFTGCVAQKLAARAAIVEHEDNRTGNPSVISESLALELALRNGLASAKTSFISVLENPVVDPNIPSELKVISPPCTVQPYTTESYHARSGVERLGRQRMSHQLPASQINFAYMEESGADGLTVALRSSSKAKNWNSVGERVRSMCASFGHGRSKSNPMSLIPGVDTNKSLIMAKKSPRADLLHHDPGFGGDWVVRLCLLQRADGSFLMSDDLIEAIGLSKHEVDSMFASFGAVNCIKNTAVFGTLLALATFRVKFSQRRSVWALQEEKALAFLGSIPTAAGLLEKAEDQVSKLFLS